MPQSEPQLLNESSFVRGELIAGKQSAIAKYQGLVTAKPGLFSLLKYELLSSVIGPLPGAVGLALRKVLFKRLFREVGGGVIFGRNVTVRHGENIRIGSGVIIDDDVVLDGRGAGEEGVTIGDNVFIGRGAGIQAKFGPITIGDGSNIGANSHIVSMGAVHIGKSALIAGDCCISGGMYGIDDPDKPVMDQGIYTRGPVVIGDGVWLGMKACVIDAVTVGKNAVIGTGAVVTKDVPDYGIAVGVPAKVVKLSCETSEPSDPTPAGSSEADEISTTNEPAA